MAATILPVVVSLRIPAHWRSIVRQLYAVIDIAGLGEKPKEQNNNGLNVEVCF